ncbi:hypothetical protein [Desulfovibrio litoralis]|uniref:Uncharacterized protein n=1 Tax=Desulfovibrio litoralis DSM 11393 TaxID=1121455 RepID=A0A1M7RTT9_9BACT|nr:hypothetical protein [Desulfovibrio litoralis]SHN49452.1 hypothetical protein SAMN02745728_00135 [Desulfovibrio litoralis DSM 11393]
MSISATMFRDGTQQILTPAEEEQKRFMYDSMSPRRRKYIDRIGYENWDPFQKPNDPLDIRQDPTKRTTQQLIREFLQQSNIKDYSNEYGKGALECAIGIINKDEKYRGIFDFAVWYTKLLQKEGFIEPDSIK